MEEWREREEEESGGPVGLCLLGKPNTVKILNFKINHLIHVHVHTCMREQIYIHTYYRQCFLSLSTDNKAASARHCSMW